MTRKQRRFYLILVSGVLLVVATALILTALEDEIIYFQNPSDVAAGKVVPAKRFRLGGLVAEGSLQRLENSTTVTFGITDTAATVSARYTGLLPDLFREGQGVIAVGTLNDKGVFEASEILAKHDENYMPPEVAEALKRSGQWKGSSDE